MTEDRYTRMMRIMGSRRRYGVLLNLFDKLITILVALSYVMLVLYEFYTGSDRLISTIAVPGVSFLAVSLFRSGFNSGRPYEIYGVAPVLKKDTHGKSFPSRHVFSVFIIGMAYYVQDPVCGFVIFTMGFMLGVIRVFGGVHFIRDVVVGAAAGGVCGLIGFYII